MGFNEAAALAVSIALTAVLAWAAAVDVRRRRIPNVCVLCVTLLYVVWAALHSPASALSGLAAGATALVACFVLYLFRVFGAGDAKLFAAVALFAGLPLLPALGMATALAGGAIVLVSLAANPRRALAVWEMRGRLDDGRGVPYGLAIALGALLVHWAARLDLLPAGLS